MSGSKGTIGILTGGGDVPGLNPAIRAVTIRALREGYRVLGIRRGWRGLVDVVPDKDADNSACVMDLTEPLVNRAGRTGGTFLHSSRTRASHLPRAFVPPHLKDEYTEEINDITPAVLRNLDFLGVDTLIPIGGDDTLSYGHRLHEEGVKVVAIPKTMDNDVPGTDYCIGFSTCVTRTIELTHRLRTPVGSHERFLVVEMFGRNCGMTALMAGYLADVDRTLIAEVPFDIGRLAELMTADRAKSGSNYAIAVVSEGASVIGEDILQSGPADAYGHRKLGGIGERVGQALKVRTGINVMTQNLAYLLRAGAPDAMDRMVPKNYGIMAVRLIEEGSTGLMVAVEEGRYTTKPADISTKGKRRVDVDAMYDKEAYRPRIARLDGEPMFLR